MLVSYVVTIYNKAQWLGPVMARVAAERAATGGEIIAVDDGSTDDSPAILSDLCARDASIRVIRQENAGVTAATNAGIAAVDPSCGHIRLVDGDDLLVPASTGWLLGALAGSGAGLAYGRAGTYDTGDTGDDGAEIAGGVPSWRTIEDPLLDVLGRQRFNPSCTLIARSLADAIFPLPGARRTSQDFAIAVRAAVRGRFVALDAETCLVPRVAADRLSRNLAPMYRDTVELALALEQEGGWSGAHRRRAVYRNATRALNYCRRHREGGVANWAALMALRLSAPACGGRTAYAAALRRIADCYSSAASR